MAPLDDAPEQLAEDKMTEMRQEEAHIEAAIASLKSKARYLVHLRAEASSQEEQRICMICQQAVEVGVLTVCGHQYCKTSTACFDPRLWRDRHGCSLGVQARNASGFGGASVTLVRCARDH